MLGREETKKAGAAKWPPSHLSNDGLHVRAEMAAAQSTRHQRACSNCFVTDEPPARKSSTFLRSVLSGCRYRPPVREEG